MCARAIEKAVSSVPGVASVSVNLGSEKAEVAYDPGLASTSQMQAAIEEARQYLGVEGEETGDLEERSRVVPFREKLRRVVVGFAAGIPLMVVMFFPMAMHGSIPYLMLLVAAPVFAYISYPIFSAAWRALKNRSLNMDVMYAMGIGVSSSLRACSARSVSCCRGNSFSTTALWSLRPSCRWGATWRRARKAGRARRSAASWAYSRRTRS